MPFARTRAAQGERFAAYCVLRDTGAAPVGAGHDLGVADSTRAAYERSYREARGLPRRRPGWPRRAAPEQPQKPGGIPAHAGGAVEPPGTPHGAVRGHSSRDTP